MRPQSVLPAGYDYDAINADVLLHGPDREKCRITLTSARITRMILPPTDADMDAAVVNTSRELVRAAQPSLSAPATLAEPH